MDGDRFRSEVGAAPIGAALVSEVERRSTGHASAPGAPHLRDDEATSAFAWLEAAPRPVLLHAALAAADRVGPWTNGSADAAVEAYSRARARPDLVIAVADRLAAEGVVPVDAGSQEWWTADPGDTDEPWGRAFTDYARVHAEGAFTWAGVWTVTDPPPEIHDDLIGAWELVFNGPATRWALPLRPEARVAEIHTPDDWAELVRRYGRPSRRPHAGWELPGPNQHLAEVGELAEVPDQHAVRTHIRRHLLPDWAAVADDLDGVHLSWAGFVTTEGRIIDLGDGDVTMLRYWGSERTLWLHDVFDRPRPRRAPRLSGSINGMRGISVGPAGDLDRTTRDTHALDALLGR